MNIEKIVYIAELAGEAILEIYEGNRDIKIQHKEDSSPLTEADLAAHNIIVEELQKIEDYLLLANNTRPTNQNTTIAEKDDGPGFFENRINELRKQIETTS